MTRQRELEMLEEEKMSLTKQYERLQEEINTYGLDMVANDAGPFKDLILKRDAVRYRIKEIKDKIENFL